MGHEPTNLQMFGLLLLALCACLILRGIGWANARLDECRRGGLR